MPKIKQSFKSKLNIYVKSLDDLKVENESVFCMICVKPIHVNESKYKCRIDEHLSSGQHLKNKELREKGEKKIQMLLKESMKSSEEKTKKEDYFKSRLTEALIESNIPLKKLNNQSFQAFLEEFTERRIPNESTLRLHYVEPLYKRIIEKIREKVDSNYVYFIIDEATDTCERKVLNVLVGVLNGEYSKPMLIDVKFHENTKHSSIQTAFLDSCQLLWSNGIQYNKVLLLVTDAAPYMTCSATNLKTFFSNMSHITCIVHALDRVCRKIQENFANLNQFIASMKKCLLNSKSKEVLYKEVTGLRLPPVPVITRWNTWLETALFYRENFNQIKEFIESIKSDSKNESTKQIKRLVKEDKFIQELLEIKD